MKKILSTIIFLFLISNTAFAQYWWSPKQQDTIDSLKLLIANLGADIDSVGTIGLPPLTQGYMLIGNATGYPASRVISGDATIDYLGNLTIGAAKISDSKINTGINATKIGSGTVSNTEYGYLDGLTANIQSQINLLALGSGFLYASSSFGNQTATSFIRFTLNGVRFSSAATSFSPSGVYFGIPTFISNPTLSTLWLGDMYYLGGQTDTDGSGLPLHTIKLVGLDQDYNRILLTFWDASKTQRAIDDIVTYNEAPDSNNSVSYLDFSNKNVVTAWFGTDVAQTIEVINYEPRMISCFVQSQEGVTFDFNGKTVEYADRIALPAFTDQKVYLVTMIYSKNKVYVSYVEYGSAL